MNSVQQQTSQPPSNPTQLRIAYQQRASAFLFQHAAAHPKTSWIGEAARSMTLRALYSRPYENNNVINAHHDDSHTPRNGSPITWKDYVCIACGTPTYPLPPSNPSSPPAYTETPSQITLRTLRRGRTRRRRSSRSRAAQFHKEAIFQKRIGTIGNANNLHSLALAWEEKQRMQMASLHRLGDGRARHCVVIHCRFCGTEKKRKGVEIKSVGKKVKKKKTVVSSSSTGTTNTTTRHCAQSSEKIKKQNDLEDSNFISLPNLGNMTQKNKRKVDKVHHDTNTAVPSKHFSFKHKTTSTTTTPAAAITSPLLSGGKKKKVKKKPVTSKGLMDFLSSLND
ncbi:hypothetical protein HJC23_007469 [Cyclotella cryptica]|uniref:GATA-type domain-containing protein n=1 Tax=Cyclotella cryptica TaxID=29204 RepID=A0ABD3NS84_9STRA